MDVTIDVVSIIAILGTIGTIVFAFLTFRRNSHNDDENEGKMTGTILTELGYMKAGIDEIRADSRDQRGINTDHEKRISANETSVVEIKAEQREQRKTSIETGQRLTAAEESTKQAHKRIDRVENIEKA